MKKDSVQKFNDLLKETHALAEVAALLTYEPNEVTDQAGTIKQVGIKIHLLHGIINNNLEELNTLHNQNNRSDGKQLTIPDGLKENTHPSSEKPNKKEVTDKIQKPSSQKETIPNTTANLRDIIKDFFFGKFEIYNSADIPRKNRTEDRAELFKLIENIDPEHAIVTEKEEKNRQKFFFQELKKAIEEYKQYLMELPNEQEEVSEKKKVPTAATSELNTKTEQPVDVQNAASESGESGVKEAPVETKPSAPAQEESDEDAELERLIAEEEALITTKDKKTANNPPEASPDTSLEGKNIKEVCYELLRGGKTAEETEAIAAKIFVEYFNKKQTNEIDGEMYSFHKVMYNAMRRVRGEDGGQEKSIRIPWSNTPLEKLLKGWTKSWSEVA